MNAWFANPWAVGLLALGPLLHGSNRDVWQLKMLEGEAVSSAAGARRGPAASVR
jgi:hypothetical protein